MMVNQCFINQQVQGSLHICCKDLENLTSACVFLDLFYFVFEDLNFF